MRAISLQDTRTRERIELAPPAAGPVGIYVCGPTVYGRAHVGNARPFVVFSLLKRFLEHEGHEVVLVANVTDVNDKIYAAARAAGRPSSELAREMLQHYLADTDGLGLGRPDSEPLATDAIADIVELIGALVDGGHAYAAGGDVYFRVRSLPAYGELSHRDVEAMDQGEEAGSAELKQDGLDFALWKGHKPGEDTCWESPWGRGRPGWHIECSAMAERALGLGFEIHGGGSDLLFPHHENEAAQTLAARGRPLARIWMHNGMLQFGGEKMAKSVGNVRGLADALHHSGRDALLMLFCAGHYRQPIAYSTERLLEAQAAVQRVREAGRRLGPGPSPPELRSLREAFFDALADDFNTPKALALLFDWVREANRRTKATGGEDLHEMLDVLGLADLLDAGAQAPPEAVALACERDAARSARDFARADRLRDQLLALGWAVRDGPDGPSLVPAPR